MTEPPEEPKAVSGGTAPRVDGGRARKRLWARLLAGRVTEVCVLSHRGLSRDLPQTLGLEVIDYWAYIYDARGVVRAPVERAQIAQELAAEPRWLAVGGPRFWVEPFARRAEVILVMPSAAAEFDLALNSSIYTAIDSVDSYFKALLTGRRRKRVRRADDRRDQFDSIVGRVVAAREHVSDLPMDDADMRAHYMWMRNFLVGEFPGKTFVLTSGAQVRELRSVRAVPRA